MILWVSTKLEVSLNSNKGTARWRHVLNKHTHQPSSCFDICKTFFVFLKRSVTTQVVPKKKQKNSHVICSAWSLQFFLIRALTATSRISPQGDSSSSFKTPILWVITKLQASPWEVILPTSEYKPFPFRPLWKSGIQLLKIIELILPCCWKLNKVSTLVVP